jgi:hypothetical protein
MGIIDEYWAGTLQRLQAEVEIFNRLIEHQGERGRENEQALARVLEGLVPGRLGVGTGLLFDVNGGYSKQMDIVLFDRVDSPRILAQTTQVLHPVEEVGLCIEVKTTLGKEEIEDAAAKKSSVAALRRHDGYAAPLFALFAYDAETAPATLAKNLEALEPDQRPDLTCVLDPGFLAGPRSLLRPDDGEDDYVCGVTLLHDTDGDGHRVSGSYVAGETGKWESRELRNGTIFPVVKFNGTRMLSEPARALLLFCEAVVRTLSARSGRSDPVLSRYLQDPYRDLETVT